MEMKILDMSAFESGVVTGVSRDGQIYISTLEDLLNVMGLASGFG